MFRMATGHDWDLIPGEDIVTNTLKALNRVADSGIGRSDLYTCHPDKLEIEDGYNMRTAFFSDYWESDEATARIRKLADAYMRGDHIDPIIVEVVDGRVLVRSGEHRTRAIRLAREEGWTCDKIRVIQLDVPKTANGRVKDEDVAKARMKILITGNAGSPASPISEGFVYARLRREFEMTDAQIAEEFQCSAEKVRIYRAYLKMPSELIEMAQRGEISAKAAYATWRKHGDKAIKVARGEIKPEKKVPESKRRIERATKVTNDVRKAFEGFDFSLSVEEAKRFSALLTELETALNGKLED